jgi:hypothetical protein
MQEAKIKGVKTAKSFAGLFVMLSKKPTAWK